MPIGGAVSVLRANAFSSAGDFSRQTTFAAPRSMVTGSLFSMDPYGRRWSTGGCIGICMIARITRRFQWRGPSPPTCRPSSRHRAYVQPVTPQLQEGSAKAQRGRGRLERPQAEFQAMPRAAHSIGVDMLGPQRRALMRANAGPHMDGLAGTPHEVFAVLDFDTSDF